MAWSRLEQLPTGAVAILLATGLLIALLASRRFWVWLFGPVFAYETARLARLGRVTLLRCGFVGVLLIALYVVFPSPASLGRQELQQFADRFCQLYLIVQAAVILLLTPLFVAGAVSDEKERQSLDFLLVSPLRDHEIILGKLMARLVTLLSILLAGLPVLALTQLWGGVDLVRVFVGMAATALSALSTGGIAVVCSVFCRHTVSSTFLAYGAALWVQLGCLCLPAPGISSPIALEYHLELLAGASAGQILYQEVINWLGLYVLFHVGVAAVGVLVATTHLRTAARPPEPFGLAHVTLPQPPAVPPEVTPEPVADWHIPLPPIGRHPLLWKERFLDRSTELQLLRHLAWASYAAIMIASCAYLLTTGISQQYERHVVSCFLFIGAALPFLFGLGLRAAGGVSREREKRTLECLLSLPETRAHILAVKLLGAILCGYRGLIAVTASLCIALVCGVTDLLSLLLVLLAFAVHTLFVANLGIFLSTVCRSTLVARMTTLIVLVSLCIGAWLYLSNRRLILFTAVSSGEPMPLTTVSVLDALSPIHTWLALAVGSRPRNIETWVAGLSGIAIYLVASGVLWLGSVRLFRRETV